METNIKLTILPIVPSSYTNEYTEKMMTGGFTESIRINLVTCVYRQWESTQVSLESMPMSHFPILKG